MAKDMKKIFEQMASVATKALMPVALAATLAPAAQAQDEGEPAFNPFVANVENNAAILFQPSLIGTVSLNRVNLYPALAAKQIGIGNNSFLAKSIGAHFVVEKVARKRFEFGYEYAPGQDCHLIYGSFPLLQPKEGAFVSADRTSHVSPTVDLGAMGFSTPEGNGMGGLFVQAGLQNRIYFRDNIGLQFGAAVRGLGAVGNGEPITQLKFVANVGLTIAMKR